VIRALRKLLNVLLIDLGHLLWLHLELLFWLLGYNDWILYLRSTAYRSKHGLREGETKL
jgi:hypothetical protein